MAQQTDAQRPLHQRIDGGLEALGDADLDVVRFKEGRGQIGLVDVGETRDLDESHSAKPSRSAAAIR